MSIASDVVEVEREDLATPVCLAHGGGGSLAPSCRAALLGLPLR